MDQIANLVTSVQMTNWLAGAAPQQSGLASVDQWNFGMKHQFHLVVDPNDMDYGGLPDTNQLNVNGAQISAQTYLDKLRAWIAQGGGTLAAGAGAAPSGGTGTGATGPTGTPAAGGGATKTGQGVLGMTNCAFCQQLAANPIMLVLLAAAVYFLFIED